MKNDNRACGAASGAAASFGLPILVTVVCIPGNCRRLGAAYESAAQYSNFVFALLYKKNFCSRRLCGNMITTVIRHERKWCARCLRDDVPLDPCMGVWYCRPCLSGFKAKGGACEKCGLRAAAARYRPFPKSTPHKLCRKCRPIQRSAEQPTRWSLRRWCTRCLNEEGALVPFLGACYCRPCLDQAHKDGLHSCYTCHNRVAVGTGKARVASRTRATLQGPVTHICTVAMCSVCSNGKAEQEQKA